MKEPHSSRTLRYQYGGKTFVTTATHKKKEKDVLREQEKVSRQKKAVQKFLAS